MNSIISAVESLYTSVSYGVLVCDLELNVLWSNPFAQKIYSAMLKDKQITKYFSQPNRLMALIALREKESFDCVIKMPDNTLHTASAVKLNGFRPLCLVTIHSPKRKLKDQTPSPDTARLLESLCRNFVPQLSDSFNMLNRISHTVKTDALPDSEDISSLFVRYYTMLRAIRNINEYQNLYQDKIDFRPTRLNISLYLNQLLEEIELKLKTYGIHLSYNLKSSEQIISYADQRMLTLIIVNIISNACLYKEQNSRINVNLKQHGDEYIISVKNHGDQIPREQIRRFFEPFYSYDLNSNSPKGIGLGLPICRMIARLHDGECKFSSTHKYGNVCTIKLPIHDVGGGQLRQPSAHSKDPYGYINDFFSFLFFGSQK